MKTIHPLKLEALLEASQPVEILDIRPRSEFEKVHIEGAHSIPSAEISAEKLVCTRELLQTEPIYLVSGGMLRWQSDGLPVVRHHTVTDWIAERRERICEAWQAKDTAKTPVACGT